MSLVGHFVSAFLGTNTSHAAQRNRHCELSHSLTLLEPRPATNTANTLRPIISAATIGLLSDHSTKTVINQHTTTVGNTIEPMSRTNQGKCRPFAKRQI